MHLLCRLRRPPLRFLARRSHRPSPHWTRLNPLPPWTRPELLTLPTITRRDLTIPGDEVRAQEVEEKAKTGAGAPNERTKAEENGGRKDRNEEAAPDQDAEREDRPAKRRRLHEPREAKGDGEAEERRPKRKVAVMIGYAGTGYKGMQINAKAKTIEGDLFAAFVAAGAISKANSDDPKKSSFVRCARTDKGVHAAGNVISLKLIVEDGDIVQKINQHLPAQIRVWGFERTNGSFSCYQLCDSRVYEYLIPTYVFLPPHPRTHLARRLVEAATVANDLAGYRARQVEVASFWDEAEEEYLRPVLDKIKDPQRQAAVLKAVFSSSDTPLDSIEDAGRDEVEARSTDGLVESDDEQAQTGQEDGPATAGSKQNGAVPDPAEHDVGRGGGDTDELVRELKAALLRAKKSYRISARRLQRIRDGLGAYVGTRNFHNYTPDKHFHDPSAKRHIKSFVADEPLIIGDMEWLSLKVHGQSFMMHQIRKMVGMVALIVRAGCVSNRIPESYGMTRLSIPKAPGLGLLLERPVFDSYNERAVTEFKREKIDFAKYESAIEEFKQREIYDRIFREEEEGNL